MTATLRVSLSPPRAWLRIEGDLDVPSRGPLAWRLCELEDLGCTTLYLDLGQVTSVDASSLRLIDDALARMTAGGATCQVTSASRCVARMTTTGGYAELAAQVDRLRAVPVSPPRLQVLPGGQRSPVVSITRTARSRTAPE
jgi:anti-anti-sigma factor